MQSLGQPHRVYPVQGTVRIQGLAAFLSSHDSIGIMNRMGLSIPIESNHVSLSPYRWTMGKKSVWEDWGVRFRVECRLKDISTRQLADRIGLAESSVRSWLNGTREINLADFFRLC